MVKYRKYRRYYRKVKARILRNYFKGKLDTVQKVTWTGNGAFFVTGGQGTTRTLSDLLQLCGDWQYYRQIFHTYKVTGLAMELTPNPATRGDGTQFTGAACIGLLTTRDIANWTNVTESNMSVLLTASQIQRKYKSFYGGLAAWHGTDDTADLDGKFVIETDGNPSDGGTTYMFKVTFYITFKNAN